MKVYILENHQFIKAPLKNVFDFFSKPENLKEITPSKLNFKILTPTPISMKEGTLIDYTIKLFGIPLHVPLNLPYLKCRNPATFE